MVVIKISDIWMEEGITLQWVSRFHTTGDGRQDGVLRFQTAGDESVDHCMVLS